MELVILNSAHKHGITTQSIRSWWLNFRSDLLLDIPPPKRLFAGFDHAGTALEIVALEDAERDRLVVIHAMKLRKQFYYLLQGGTYGL
jgi:transposase-like protein